MPWYVIQDSTSSSLLPDSSYSCCSHDPHTVVVHPINITTAHEILQPRECQSCKLTLLPNHSSSWTREEQVDVSVHRKLVHPQSHTFTRKPSHSLMHAKLRPKFYLLRRNLAMLSTNERGMRNPAQEFGHGGDCLPSCMVQKHCS
jgi:hypothetical protein